MAEEVILLNPDKLGYKDRGKMKWQGMMLSDHTEALKKMKAEEQAIDIPAKEEMTVEEISKMLYEAYVTKSPVAIQANVLRNGQYYPDVHCLVLGYLGEKIILQLKNGSIKRVNIDLIRNVEVFNVLKWHNKRTE
ncbi:YolD-like family protein [Marinilactibacillus piezotolerans]|uniref:YolD-like family protein n=1 Tax=Marinilactibacillus piezotolerans TaxID=258723 RepID=UPI0009B07764|nr:YolD-like family protein [Marinilactibacillus piezotolerans]